MPQHPDRSTSVESKNGGRSEAEPCRSQPISAFELHWSGAVYGYPPETEISRVPLFGSSSADRYRPPPVLPPRPIKFVPFAADRPRPALPLEKLSSDIADASEQKNISVIHIPVPLVSVLIIYYYIASLKLPPAISSFSHPKTLYPHILS